MKYGLLETPTLQASECLVVGVFADSELPDFAKKLDQQYNQIITRLLAKLGEVGDLIWQADIDGHSLVLLHCGKQAEFNQKLAQMPKQPYPCPHKTAYYYCNVLPAKNHYP